MVSDHAYQVYSTGLGTAALSYRYFYHEKGWQTFSKGLDQACQTRGLWAA